MLKHGFFLALNKFLIIENNKNQNDIKTYILKINKSINFRQHPIYNNKIPKQKIGTTI